jgi:DNA-binding CsgD family transcriptional regulator
MSGDIGGTAPTLHEIRVLREYIDGGTAKSAAERLGISIFTVQTHINNLRQKSGCHYVIQVVAWGYENGWLEKRADIGEKYLNLRICT